VTRIHEDRRDLPSGCTAIDVTFKLATICGPRCPVLTGYAARTTAVDAKKGQKPSHLQAPALSVRPEELATIRLSGCAGNAAMIASQRGITTDEFFEYPSQGNARCR